MKNKKDIEKIEGIRLSITIALISLAITLFLESLSYFNIISNNGMGVIYFLCAAIILCLVYKLENSNKKYISLYSRNH